MQRREGGIYRQRLITPVGKDEKAVCLPIGGKTDRPGEMGLVPFSGYQL
jgi:hypothetical protein